MRVNCRNDSPSSVNIWQMSQGAVGPVREDLLDHGVVPVVALGLGHHERAVSEQGVVAPEGEQFVLTFGGPCG